MARVLSDENMALLKAIREQHPESIDSLAKVVGKQPSSVSRSLHTMAEFGLVSLVKNGRTVVPEPTFEHLLVDFC
jgi:predicted transcriptional regulator